MVMVLLGHAWACAKPAAPHRAATHICFLNLLNMPVSFCLLETTVNFSRLKIQRYIQSIVNLKLKI
jgi:hypothetical protein